MKKFIQAAVVLSAFATSAAHAIPFDFSYTFGDGSAITGSLSGDLQNSFVKNISDVHVFFNGTEFSGGSLFHAAWNTATRSFDNSIGALVSTNAASNNFIFADANVPSDFDVSNYFYFVNDPKSLGHEAFATNLNSGAIAFDNPANGVWTLTAVPLPATVPLLLLGLGAMGISQRRQRS